MSHYSEHSSRLIHGPKNKLQCFSPRLGLLNLSGLEPAPSGEWTASLPAGGSLDEASESAPSRSVLHWSSYIRSDGMVSCFLSVILIIVMQIVLPLIIVIIHTHAGHFDGIRAQCGELPFLSPSVPRVSEAFGKRVVVYLQLRYLSNTQSRNKCQRNGTRIKHEVFTWPVFGRAACLD